MLFCYEVIIIDGGFFLSLECVGNGITSGFESAIQDEKGSGIEHSEEEAAVLWRRYACICNGSRGRWWKLMPSMTVNTSTLDGLSLLRCDVTFNFVSNMHIKVTSINVDIIISRVAVLLGHGVKEFSNFTFTRAHIHASNVDRARHQG